MAENVAFLNELHRSHYLRYPKHMTVPNPEAIADQTVDDLFFAITQVVNAR